MSLPVAPGPWYAASHVRPGLVRFTEPQVDPLLSANLWWLRGTDRDVVIDAGLGVVPLRRELPELFRRDPLLVLTHTHLDHAGGAHEFAERAVHAAEADALAAGTLPASLDGRELYRALGVVTGPDEAVPGLLLKALPHSDYDPRAYTVRAAPPTRLLADGERIELGGLALTVVHLPGHSPGGIVLLEERTGSLYSGDVVYDGGLIDDLDGSDVDAYVRSMEFLAGLDVSVVHPGHGRDFDRDRLHAIALRYLARARDRA